MLNANDNNLNAAAVGAVTTSLTLLGDNFRVVNFSQQNGQFFQYLEENHAPVDFSELCEKTWLGKIWKNWREYLLKAIDEGKQYCEVGYRSGAGPALLQINIIRVADPEQARLQLFFSSKRSGIQDGRPEPGTDFYRELVQVAVAQRLSFMEKIEILLKSALRHLDFDLGWLASVKEGIWRPEIQFSISPSIPLPADLPIGETFCGFMLGENRQIEIPDTNRVPGAVRLMRSLMGVQSYTGMPIIVDGKSWGVLGFGKLQPRTEGLPGKKQEVIRLIAQWIGLEIQRDLELAQLKQYMQDTSDRYQDLEEANEAALLDIQQKNEFLATISHEIRTPLNAVIGMTELLISTEPNPTQQEYLDVIRDSSQVLLALINDVVKFVSQEKSYLTLQNERFCLLDLVEGAVDMFISQAREKGLVMMEFVSPEIPRFLTGDPIRLRQVFMNLISNALRFTEVGEIVVHVRAEKIIENRVLLRTEVRDTGVGIPFGSRKVIFHGGTGKLDEQKKSVALSDLGLGITKHLVEQMGGEIGVESAELQGSTFWFTAWLDIAQEHVTEETESVEDFSILSGRRVLVVDDNPEHLEFLAIYLENTGMRVGRASSGNDAIRQLVLAANKGKSFDAAIIDLQMPDLDGYMLAERIKQMPEIAHTRMVLLTAAENRNVRDDNLQLGFAAYLTKPVKRYSLLQTVEQAIYPGGRESMRALQISPETSPVGLSTTRPPQRGGLILLAEDNPANQKLAVVQLNRLGYQVEAVSNGLEAVESVRNDPGRFILIFMDCQMPEMDGFAATVKIREIEEGTNVRLPIIAMTANALAGDREICIAAGMDDYVSKPVTLDALQQVINSWVGRPLRKGKPTGSLKTQQDYSPVDENTIASIRGLQAPDEPDFLTELIDMYLLDSRATMQEIQTSLDTLDMEKLRRSLHTLRGVSGNLGARGLAGYLGEMEKMADSGEVDLLAAWMPKVQSEYQRVVERLEELRKN